MDVLEEPLDQIEAQSTTQPPCKYTVEEAVQRMLQYYKASTLMIIIYKFQLTLAVIQKLINFASKIDL